MKRLHENKSSKVHTPIKSSRINRRKKIILFLIIGSFLFLGSQQYVVDYGTVIYHEQVQSEAVVELAQKTDLSTKGKAIFYSTYPEIVDANRLNEVCPNEVQDTIEYGCYKPGENRMYILKISDNEYREIQYNIVAHEMLHAAYDKLSSSIVNEVNASLSKLYETSNNQDVVEAKKMIDEYDLSSQADILNEMHSFAGASIQDFSELQNLELHYKQYFNNRQTAVRSEKSFNKKIDSKTAQLKNRLNNLESKRKEIDNYKYRWLDTIKRYMQQNSYYGDYYTYNKNVDAYNNNLVNYNRMVDEYERERIELNKEINKFNSLLKSFRPDTQILQVE